MKGEIEVLPFAATKMVFHRFRRNLPNLELRHGQLCEKSLDDNDPDRRQVEPKFQREMEG